MVLFFCLLVNGIHGGRICFSSLIALKKRTKAKKWAGHVLTFVLRFIYKSWIDCGNRQFYLNLSIDSLWKLSRYISQQGMCPSLYTKTNRIYMIRLLSDYRIIMIQLICVYVSSVCSVECNLVDVWNIHMHVIAPNLNSNVLLLLLTRMRIK